LIILITKLKKIREWMDGAGPKPGLIYRLFFKRAELDWAEHRII
jgi:hypothetical protein